MSLKIDLFCSDRGYKYSKCFTNETRLFTTVDEQNYKKILARHKTVSYLSKRDFLLSHRHVQAIHKHRM